MSGLWPSGLVAVLTQGFALGCDIAAPLALRAVGVLGVVALRRAMQGGLSTIPCLRSGFD